MFTPDEHLIKRSHRIIAAMKEAAIDGRGAVSLDGRLIDAASIRMAENLLAKLEQIESAQRPSTPPADAPATRRRAPRVPALVAGSPMGEALPPEAPLPLLAGASGAGR